ncbi:hypothetical protein HPP92_027066 [Vanilla planifolia]|uniref:Uncharacterized protein n=1 Tax=Vanilla planifolia TaxID=51239 RepID=A0A835PD55_VANPL|nr:hypothetical protein HPP92_027066 [Vanilla planifolia]
MAAEIARQAACVMGATSRLGSALVDLLLLRGYDIHVATFSRGHLPFLHASVFRFYQKFLKRN